MELKESEYPVDDRGKPDLRCYTDPLEYYIEMYEQHLGALQGRKGEGYEIELVHSRRVHATWGLMAKGAMAKPYALGLLQHSEPEAREDGAAILAAIERDEAVVDQVIRSLDSETDVTVRDSLIATLGQLKSGKAIPALAAIIRNEHEDADTKWTAIESLGLIVRQEFLNQDEPVEAAKTWIDVHPDAVQ